MDSTGRIASTFSNPDGSRRFRLMPFLPAGYPDLATTIDSIQSAAAGGAGLIEIGFPFSDPIADGPTIQAAFTAALAKGLKVAEIFTAVATVRPSVSIPLVAMVSYSIVYRYGVDRFFADARSAGFDGIILPDLPPPEAAAVCRQCWDAGLDTVLLVSPTTPPARRAEIARLSTGFIYYLSVSGVTGERSDLPADLAEHVAQLKSLTDKPVCVGFGISSADQVKRLAAVADGAIVGSAVVKRMGGPPAEVAAAVGEFCRTLLGG